MFLNQNGTVDFAKINNLAKERERILKEREAQKELIETLGRLNERIHYHTNIQSNDIVRLVARLNGNGRNDEEWTPNQRALQKLLSAYGYCQWQNINDKLFDGICELICICVEDDRIRFDTAEREFYFSTEKSPSELVKEKELQKQANFAKTKFYRFILLPLDRFIVTPIFRVIRVFS